MSKLYHSEAVKKEKIKQSYQFKTKKIDTIWKV